MTRPKRLLVLGILAPLLVACGPGPGPDDRAAGSSAGAENDVGRPGADRPAMGMGRMMRMMGAMPEGIAPDELPEARSHGARLVAWYCGQCHGVPTPKRLAAEEWRPTLRRMIVRMERMGRMIVFVGGGCPGIRWPRLAHGDKLLVIARMYNGL